MRRAIKHHPCGHWPAGDAAAAITLAWDDRHRRRILLTDDSGAEFLLDLPQATLLAHGDGLELDGGGWIAVQAAEEEVAEVYPATPEALARIAWAVGNRHMPVQILPGGGLRLPWDHVLAHMIEHMGAKVAKRRAAFQPDGGAYAGHGHEH